MATDNIARAMANAAIKVDINAGHTFDSTTTRDAFFTSNPTQLNEKMYIYCAGKLQQRLNNQWVDRTVAIKGEKGDSIGLMESSFTISTDGTTTINHGLSYNSAHDILDVVVDGVLLSKPDNYTETSTTVTLNGWSVNTSNVVKFRLFKDVK